MLPCSEANVVAFSRTKLAHQILAAFRTARSNEQWDTAECLLRALETLSHDSASTSSLARAYALVAGTRIKPAAEIRQMNRRDSGPHVLPVLRRANS